ncbi:MAG TPA: hypothetical protein DIW17_17780 [Clostridiales bacterium]|jgi:tetratricopeptide (TPR) repeat protein|nr:hypothetical protein [Clostridiales bacterium]
MSDYYQLLNISPDSGKDDIKKAYFRLIRKYPPDKEPEQFMAIREAYEALSNEQTRQEYDRIFLMDNTARIYYQTAREYIDNGQYQMAVNLLKEAFKFYPQVTLLHELYGDVLLLNNNSKTAVRIFEKLVENNPNHAGFLNKLANAQVQMGWWKKAYMTYNQALSIDRENMSIWHGWIDLLLNHGYYDYAYGAVEEAIGIAKENNSDTISLMFKRIHLSYYMNKPRQLILDQIDQIIDVAEHAGGDEKESVGWFLHKLVEIIHMFEELSFTEKLIERVKILIPQESKKLDQILFDTRELQLIIPQYNQFVDDEKDKINSTLYQHIVCFLPPYIEGRYGFESREEYICCRLVSEYMLLSIRNELKSNLLYIKREYPALYEFFGDFFNTLQKPYEAAKMEKAKFKQIQMNPEVMRIYKKMEADDDADAEDYLDDDWDDYCDDYWDDDQDDHPKQMPYVRETPKIGRNDPCPCGSGKKYKKCCG